MAQLSASTEPMPLDALFDQEIDSILAQTGADAFQFDDDGDKKKG